MYLLLLNPLTAAAVALSPSFPPLAQILFLRPRRPATNVACVTNDA